MTLTNSLVTFADATLQLLKDHQEELDIYQLFYGDQNKLPGTPVVCVEPDFKNNDLRAAQRQLQHRLVCQVLVYTSEVTSGEQNRRNADLLSERIESVLHLDPTIGGIAIHSYVESITSGYATKAGTLVKADRIQFAALSQSRLPW